MNTELASQYDEAVAHLEAAAAACSAEAVGAIDPLPNLDAWIAQHVRGPIGALRVFLTLQARVDQALAEIHAELARLNEVIAQRRRCGDRTEVVRLSRYAASVLCHETDLRERASHTAAPRQFVARERIVSALGAALGQLARELGASACQLLAEAAARARAAQRELELYRRLVDEVHAVAGEASAPPLSNEVVARVKAAASLDASQPFEVPAQPRPVAAPRLQLLHRPADGGLAPAVR